MIKNNSEIKIKSEAGLKKAQSKNQTEFYKNGYLILKFSNKESLKRLLDFIEKEIKTFYQQNKSKWKQTFGGAYDLVNDKFLKEFIKENNLENLVSEIANQDYVIADAKLRLWAPGDGYLKWHRDTSIVGAKIIGKIPPDINLFFYPKLKEKSTSQLKIIKRSHRIDFQNNILNKLQTILGKKKIIYSNNSNYILFNSSILHGLPTHGKLLPTRIQRIVNSMIDKYLTRKKYYPRLILRFCSKRNISNYNRGLDYKNNQLPEL